MRVPDRLGCDPFGEARALLDEATQLPAWQSRPAAHVVPQAPQLPGSVLVSVHVPPQTVAGAAQPPLPPELLELLDEADTPDEEHEDPVLDEEEGDDVSGAAPPVPLRSRWRNPLRSPAPPARARPIPVPAGIDPTP
jgi:hypothetical protein